MNHKNKYAPPFLFDDRGKSYLLDFKSNRHVPTRNLQEHFEKLSAVTELDREFEKTFLIGKIRTLESHPGLNTTRRDAITERLLSLIGPSEEIKNVPPPPGGVGFGMYFNETFRSAFNTGTALAVDLIAPRKPGGNVSTWLYLAATNRAHRGAEACLLYHGQDDYRFRVFDWARDSNSHWQTNVGYSDLNEYIGINDWHGTIYQVLSIENQTYIKSGNTWTNNVWLMNYTNDSYDLVYSYEYTSSEEEQKQGSVGDWGPIIETWQDAHGNINQLGFLSTSYQSRDSNMVWSDFGLLSADDSHISCLNYDFELVFIEANHSFAVQ